MKHQWTTIGKNANGDVLWCLVCGVVDECGENYLGVPTNCINCEKQSE